MFRLPDKMYEQVHEVVKNGRAESMSELIRKATTQFLEQNGKGMAKQFKHGEEVRELWRESQRKYRAKKRAQSGGNIHNRKKEVIR